jgi:hypothetical protein
MLGIAIGLLYANAGEWLLHKYVLHGLGRKKTSVWSYHWHEHHRHARKLGHKDPDYERSLFRWNAQGKEALGLAAMALVHLPLMPVFPFFTATVELSIARYYYVHKRAHRDPGWAREHLPWHYDHHMGPNQDANWGVTWPWMDWVMNTRDEYVGTDRERSSRERRAHGLVPESGAPMSLTPGTVTS